MPNAYLNLFTQLIPFYMFFFIVFFIYIYFFLVPKHLLNLNRFSTLHLLLLLLLCLFLFLCLYLCFSFSFFKLFCFLGRKHTTSFISVVRRGASEGQYTNTHQTKRWLRKAFNCLPINSNLKFLNIFICLFVQIFFFLAAAADYLTN